ncbi:MAG: hypothetical protein IJF49_08530 [Clostridia bacterium]|nr:hypothetical protein [Clostridia bacterium]
MLYLEGNTIRLTRGDTAFLSVPIVRADTGEPYDLAEGDTLEFSLKKYTSDEEPIFQKKIIGGNTFTIRPDDTSGLRFGKYKYDVQLTTAQGHVFTVIEASVFEVMEEVT